MKEVVQMLTVDIEESAKTKQNAEKNLIEGVSLPFNESDQVRPSFSYLKPVRSSSE